MVTTLFGFLQRYLTHIKNDKWAGDQFCITASHFLTHIFQLYSYR